MDLSLLIETLGDSRVLAGVGAGVAGAGVVCAFWIKGLKNRLAHAQEEGREFEERCFELSAEAAEARGQIGRAHV